MTKIEAASRAVKIVSGKWKVEIIYLIHTLHVVRFGEFAPRLPGITTKMLTQQLKGLVADGVVKRTSHHVVPKRVEYELTPLGREIFDGLEVLGSKMPAGVAIASPTP